MLVSHRASARWQSPITKTRYPRRFSKSRSVLLSKPGLGLVSGRRVRPDRDFGLRPLPQARGNPFADNVAAKCSVAAKRDGIRLRQLSARRRIW